ncbi:hypothetical protein RvY_07233 [Ramazzottius varieornatus]|uniref:Uncharacterized protein n=1 Tax=Ramazzottius varieornatus TaxID=947166 RepID=A0A1D1VAU7_RAMVA|nr:hypothetical protein RvY_07233 [Ramazzottius varieornatus]
MIDYRPTERKRKRKSEARVPSARWPQHATGASSFFGTPLDLNPDILKELVEEGREISTTKAHATSILVLDKEEKCGAHARH